MTARCGGSRIRASGRPRGGPREGYALAEAVITAAATATIIVAVFLVLETEQANYARETQKIDLQQNVRIGLDDFIRDLRLAGYGVPSPPSPSVLPVFCNPCPAVGPFPACGTAGSTSATAVAFMADLENASTTVTADATTPNSLRVSSHAKFLQSGTPAPPPDHIFITDGMTWDAVTVTGVSGSGSTQTITFTPNTAGNKLYPAGSFVGRPRCIVYRTSVDPSTGRTVLQRDAGDNRGMLTIAENIQSLDLAYYDNNDVEIIPGSPGANLATIRRVSALFSGTATVPGQAPRSVTLARDVRPRNLR